MTGYTEHSLWSDPGRHADRMAELPEEPLALADALENFRIHHAAARYLGFGVPDYAESDRTLRRMDLLLDTMLERDGRTLAAHRDLPHYLYGTCHDFALFAVAAMRTRSIEARLRAGYVDYHAKGRWEDHWVCEYRFEGEWLLLDAQMGRRAREGFGIKFPIENVPRDRFRSGAQIWQAIRSGALNADICGVSFAGISGEWFPATSVLRDAAARSVISAPFPSSSHSFRHPREGGDPERYDSGRVRGSWIPAFAGMTMKFAVSPCSSLLGTPESVFKTGAYRFNASRTVFAAPSPSRP